MEESILDTNIELLDFLDNLLKFDAWFSYMNFENEKGRYSEINIGSDFGAVKGDMFVESLLKKYLSFNKKRNLLFVIK